MAHLLFLWVNRQNPSIPSKAIFIAIPSRQKQRLGLSNKRFRSWLTAARQSRS